MILLAQAEQARARVCEQERLAVRARLTQALSELVPGQGCWLYGSITQPGRFREWSDVDLALEQAPADRSIFLLMSLLSERLQRPVDLVVLGETRLAEKIVREGERWIG